MIRQGSHLRAVVQALFVVFLWATSWVLIKIGLEEIPALTFAGLRYILAFLCLLPVVLLSRQTSSLGSISRRTWGRLLILGLLLYSITQGATFVALAYLPAVTVNLLSGTIPSARFRRRNPASSTAPCSSGYRCSPFCFCTNGSLPKRSSGWLRSAREC
jgi:drug/metabolite transporter (DMT)-like permease